MEPTITTLTHYLILAVLTFAACTAVLGPLVWRSDHREQAATEAAIAGGVITLAVWIAYGVAGWVWVVPVALWGLTGARWAGERRIKDHRPDGQQAIVRERLPLHIETNVKAFKPGSGWDRRIREHGDCYDTGGIAVGPFSVIVPPGHSANRNADSIADEFADLLGGEWTAVASDNSSRITVERMPEFGGDAAHTLINEPPETADEAAAEYPDLVIPRGRDCRGNIVAWKPDSPQPHVLDCGKSGSGKSSALATALTEGIAGGMAVIICDYNYSDSFALFKDLPGVIAYANTLENIDRTIAWVKDLAMRRSRTDYVPAAGDPPKGVPILLIVDEIATMRREAKRAWIDLINVLEKGRKVRIHAMLASQQITRKVIDAELRRHCPGIEQYGYLDRDEGALLWSDGGIGMSVPAVAGQGLVGRVGDTAPTRITGFHTPGTRIDRPMTRDEKRIFDTLVKQIRSSVPRLYDRLELSGDRDDTPVAGRPLRAREATAGDGGDTLDSGLDMAVASRNGGDRPDDIICDGDGPDDTSSDTLSPLPAGHLDAVAAEVIAAGRTKQPHPKVVEVLRAYLTSRSTSAAAAEAKVNRTAVRLIMAEAEKTPTWKGRQ